MWKQAIYFQCIKDCGMKKSDKFWKWLFQIMWKVQSKNYVAIYDAVFPS